MSLQASLGSYLKAETNGDVIRHFNKILRSQTSGDGHFFDFDTPLYCHFVLTTKVGKIAVFGGIFEFQMAVENFLGVVTP